MATPGKAAADLRLDVCLLDPPRGVAFAVQRGRAELLLPSHARDGALVFSFSLRLGAALSDGSFNFLGEFAQGTPADRFVYINSGLRAGQAGSTWDRRAKLKLASMPVQLVEAALGNSHHAVEAAVQASMADGSPVCATVRTQAVAWRLLVDAA